MSAGGSVVFDSPVTNAAGHRITLAGGSLATPTLTNSSAAILTGSGDISGVESRSRSSG